MLLVLGGTGEARELAGKLAEAGRPAVVSLAGAVRHPASLPLPVRIGGFGGEEGFRRYLQDSGITRVLDATHPFAERITERTARICAAIGIAHAVLHRPEWAEGTDDDWCTVGAEEDAQAVVPEGATVFLATGRQGLMRFSGLAAGRRLILRVVDQPEVPFPFPDGQFVIGRPPFALEDEIALFRRLGVDVLISKNSGGPAGRAKLAAARALHVPVVMIRRPSLPENVTVFQDVGAALEWCFE